MFAPDDDEDDDLAASALARHDLMAPHITKAGEEFFKQAKAFDMYERPCFVVASSMFHPSPNPHTPYFAVLSSVRKEHVD
jgi:hypothetical protein